MLEQIEDTNSAPQISMNSECCGIQQVFEEQIENTRDQMTKIVETLEQDGVKKNIEKSERKEIKKHAQKEDQVFPFPEPESDELKTHRRNQEALTQITKFISKSVLTALIMKTKKGSLTPALKLWDEMLPNNNKSVELETAWVKKLLEKHLSAS